ncbi:MBL fold metallo-hydrolase [Synoicihabitans lomoniglobus]|uniref:MBL fold metallo-hydrolase n=1 Tax=Synoicihabitans lomoniglobus TaxID=2909285 RepID=A0AAF0CQ79_9BACT|nr:MBL fold metallo-hydrolase [Opitutaceae bacterium LMO-M01]WED66036.1 MBL fold metallo-hydrolase [Opitutaceae bacterium LMO-M01]
MVIERAPLEDELGDVLDKAIRRSGLNEHEVAEQTSIPVERLQAVIDYTERLNPGEVAKLAKLLELNPVGLAAVASENYPLPEISGLPFCLYPLRMPHGIGVANAYLVADCCEDWGILFDCGVGAEGLWRNWPAKIKRIAAVFITHYETEHCGGLSAIRSRFPAAPIFGPAVDNKPSGVISVDDGAVIREQGFAVTVRSCPGHSEGHHCYEVGVAEAPTGRRLLVSGDLLFAGSVGGAYFCRRRLAASLQQVFAHSANDTVVAPGHGPLTTIANERAYNPFVGT